MGCQSEKEWLDDCRFLALEKQIRDVINKQIMLEKQLEQIKKELK